MMQYPYYYLGVDAWVDPKSIKQYFGSTGYIGTVPWQPRTLDVSAYPGLQSIYETANRKYDGIERAYTNDTRYPSWEMPMGTRLIYGYDAMMTVANALQRLEQEYGLWSFEDNESFLKVLEPAILNHTAFESATGFVSFDRDTGDREHGMYSFVFATEIEEVEYFGYSYFSTGYSNTSWAVTRSTFTVEMDIGRIRWPRAFEDIGIIPQSHTLKIETLSVISGPLFVTMAVLASIGIAILSCYMVWISVCDGGDGRNQRHRTKASTRLVMVMYIGVIMAYSNLIISGLDEGTLGRSNAGSLDVVCNLSVWWMVLSFTLIFTPIFAKTVCERPDCTYCIVPRSICPLSTKPHIC